MAERSALVSIQDYRAATCQLSKPVSVLTTRNTSQLTMSGFPTWG